MTYSSSGSIRLKIEYWAVAPIGEPWHCIPQERKFADKDAAKMARTILNDGDDRHGIYVLRAFYRSFGEL